MADAEAIIQQAISQALVEVFKGVVLVISEGRRQNINTEQNGATEAA